MVAALALALGGGALGVGCGDEEGTEGAGGAGGTGDGGTGGTGGNGGFCGLDICVAGEDCVTGDEGTLVCECDPENDTCEDETFCDPTELRCRDLPNPPRERQECAQEGAQEDGYICVSFGTRNQWLSMCETGDDCPMVGSFCGAEFGLIPACIPNLCGSEDPYVEGENPLPANGDTFGTCSPNGRNGNPPTGLVGSCIPFSNDINVGSCQVNGTSTDACRVMPAEFDEADACAPGMGCNEVGFVYRIPGFACTADADCHEVSGAFHCDNGQCVLNECTTDEECGEDNYCGAEGYCRQLGECTAVCNAGALGEAAGPFAGCHEEGQICTRANNATQSPGDDLVFGECGDPECSEESPCNPGFTCVEGKCVEESEGGELGDDCAEDTDCVGDLVCTDDVCAEEAAEGGELGDDCVEDTDCVGDLVCTDDVCAEEAAEGGELGDDCAEDTDCVGDLVCTDDVCAEDAGDEA